MVQPDVSPTGLVAYIAQAIHRASLVYGSRQPADPQHALALGEVVALFNLADEFGLIADVRRQVDELAGRDVYRGLSEAMKTYYLGAGAAGSAGSSPARPAPGLPQGQRPAPRRRDAAPSPGMGAPRRQGGAPAGPRHGHDGQAPPSRGP